MDFTSTNCDSVEHEAPEGSWPTSCRRALRGRASRSRAHQARTASLWRGPDEMNKAPGSSQYQQKDQTSAGPCGAQATLPVDGSMRLPCTRPVVGSVPCGRRKSRMCGSGLRKRDVHGSEASECKPERSRQVEGVAPRGSPRTGGLRSAPSRGSAARRGRATRSPIAGDPWARLWRRAWAGSRGCARGTGEHPE